MLGARCTARSQQNAGVYGQREGVRNPNSQQVLILPYVIQNLQTYILTLHMLIHLFINTYTSLLRQGILVHTYCNIQAC